MGEAQPTPTSHHAHRPDERGLPVNVNPIDRVAALHGIHHVPQRCWVACAKSGPDKPDDAPRREVQCVRSHLARCLTKTYHAQHGSDIPSGSNWETTQRQTTTPPSLTFRESSSLQPAFIAHNMTASVPPDRGWRAHELHPPLMLPCHICCVRPARPARFPTQHGFKKQRVARIRHSSTA